MMCLAASDQVMCAKGTKDISPLASGFHLERSGAPFQFAAPNS